MLVVEYVVDGEVVVLKILTSYTFLHQHGLNLMKDSLGLNSMIYL